MGTQTHSNWCCRRRRHHCKHSSSSMRWYCLPVWLWALWHLHCHRSARRMLPHEEENTGKENRTRSDTIGGKTGRRDVLHGASQCRESTRSGPYVQYVWKAVNRSHKQHPRSWAPLPPASLPLIWLQLWRNEGQRPALHTCSATWRQPPCLRETRARSAFLTYINTKPEGGGMNKNWKSEGGEHRNACKRVLGPRAAEQSCSQSFIGTSAASGCAPL